MRTFRHWIPDLDREMDKNNINIDEIVDMFEKGMGSESIVVNVDDDEDGDKVKVFIG